jgi:type I restriction enzyme R subunit
VSAGDELTRDRSKRLAIDDTLDEGLPRTYTKELYNTKCEVLFEHVYESYQGDGGSVYAS